MTDKDELNSELERFISDWYWDEESQEYAKKLGEFLFDFLDSLKAKNMKEKTYYDLSDYTLMIYDYYLFDF